MKKTLLLAIAAILAVGTTSVQAGTLPATEVRDEVQYYDVSDADYDGGDSRYNNDSFRKKYFNLNFAWQSLHFNTGMPELDKPELLRSDWGAALSTGKSFILHKRPIAGMLRLGIDATWFDLNVAHMQPQIFAQGLLPEMYQVELSMGLGVSIHLSPIGKLGVHTYARYNPTLSTLSDFNSGILGGYSSVVVFGGAVSWGTISLGVEGRWGFGSYKDWGDDSDDGSPGTKLNTKGGRVYLGFRF